MEGNLHRGQIICAVLAIPALALLWLGVFLKFHWLSGSLATAAGVSVVLGAGVWWIGRRLFVVAALIVLALIVLLLEDVADGPFDIIGDLTADKKPMRQAKLAKAIAKREALLSALDESKA